MAVSNGRVGLGTTSPGARLEVLDTTLPARFTYDADRYVDILGNVGITIHAGDAQNNPLVLTQTGGNGTTQGGILFYTGPNAGNTEKMRIQPDGNVGIGTVSPQSALHVPDGKYAQFEDNNAGAPAAGDCDADTERGRMSIDTTNNRLYICNGATRGWDYLALTD